MHKYSIKETSAEYGKEYQSVQADKFRDRNNNHWKLRIDLAKSLVEKYVLPGFKEKRTGDIVVVDVGCSVGTFAIEFAKDGFKSYGTDFDKEAISIAKQLCEEEKVSAEFICGDISEWKNTFPPIDIAICFDIFEHLHDDELGAFLQSLRKQLSKNGSLVFHTFPTEYNYIFFNKLYRRLPLIPFKILPHKLFNRITMAYAALLDTALIFSEGCTYKGHIKTERHCNPTTQERLSDILKRAGYNIVFMETSQLYPFKESIRKQFAGQPITYRNLYGVAVSA